MADAPERIWAFEDYPGSGAVPRSGVWFDEQSETPEGTPAYVRSDLVEAMEAENQRLREALEKIAATGRCEFAAVRAALLPATLRAYRSTREGG